jgi:uncharacterized protein Yka (UPF0111/DUF47 family)
MEPQESPSASNLFSTVIDLAEDLLSAARLLHAALVDPSNISAHTNHIQALEEASDATIREIIQALELSRIAAGPLSATQTITLVQNLDGAMDALEEAADFIQIYASIDRPTDKAVKMAFCLRRAAEEILGCMTRVRAYRNISSHVRAVSKAENAADEVYRAALGALVGIEADPFYTIRWKDIYDRLEESLNRCEEVAQFLGSIRLQDSEAGQ